jgi:hypothetical protein
LKENLASIHITLSDEDNARIRKLAENAELGDRYPPVMLATLFTDTVSL